LEFRVIWEIVVDAHSPKEAAEAARAEQQRDTSATVFHVWDHAKNKMLRIDVEAHPDRLNSEELRKIRARLRSLQCMPGVAVTRKHLAAAMLIFLDTEARSPSR
jgi:hypothetical protein